MQTERTLNGGNEDFMLPINNIIDISIEGNNQSGEKK